MASEITLREFVPATIRSSKKKGRVEKEFPTEISEYPYHLDVSYSFPVYNQKGMVGKRECSRDLPKFFVANHNAFAAMGVLQGEMSKTHRGPITFCNSEPVLVRLVLNWLKEAFHVEYNSWRWYIKLNIPEPEDEKLKQQLTNELLEHWLYECPVSYEKRFPTALSFIKKTKNRIPKNDGSLIIEQRDPIFVQTLQLLVEKITNGMPERSTKKVAAYMRGVIAAEACINYVLETGHRRVFITACKDEERAIFMKCLDKLEIEYKDCKPIKDIIISGRKNLERLQELDLMSLHPQKHARFCEMLASYKP